MTNIKCKKCGLVDDFTTYQQGQHIGARCNGCDAFIKWLPQNKEFIIPFGKYKGRELSSMVNKEEKDYLMWVIEQTWCKNNLANKIEEHLNNL